MLVLTRKPGEKIIIDGGITITVTEVSGGRVKIGIEAPAHVSILRGELAKDQEALQFQNHWAAADPQDEPAQVFNPSEDKDARKPVRDALLKQPLLRARIRNSFRGLRKTPR